MDSDNEGLSEVRGGLEFCFIVVSSMKFREETRNGGPMVYVNLNLPWINSSSLWTNVVDQLNHMLSGFIVFVQNIRCSSLVLKHVYSNR